VLGELIFAPEGLPETRVPLVAATAVARGGFMVRITTVAQTLLSRLAAGPETTM
jgi:D-alanyl-D-alanine carboxypeptidase (penicillin-binding protein 5/6)